VAGFGDRYSGFDRFEQRHRWLGIRSASSPVIGRQLSRGSLHESASAFGLGLAAALWARMGVFLAA
jgi:hypothetical protein